MPFSHHSHSGEFCAHAKNTLSEMIATARRRQMFLFALTEHMPRGDNDLYPEEREQGFDAAGLAKQFDAYVTEARRLQKENKSIPSPAAGVPRLQILVGCEAEWIRPEESSRLVRELLQKYPLDYIIGSVHHVRTVPIDFSRQLYLEARQACGGTDEGLFSAYFDEQYQMLQALKPTIVGHFDLVRLLSDEPNLDWTECGNGEIWAKIVRNLEYIAGYHGLVEINTSAWRKGLREPYPTSNVCATFMKLGGAFVMSDDSHAVEHIATNYEKLPEFCRQFGLRDISYLQCDDAGRISARSMRLEDAAASPFWNPL